jgi:hypothetical protein
MDKKQEKDPRKYYWNIHASSEGTMGLHLHFPFKISKQDKEREIARGLAQAQEFMLTQGYLPPRSEFMSPSDASQRFGKTRQYWEKLLNEGKIPYKETSAGMITTDLWIQGYLNNKEAVDEYVRLRNQAIRDIEADGRRWGKIVCPKCKEKDFDFNVNTNNINGLCRAGCGFRIHTVK